MLPKKVLKTVETRRRHNEIIKPGELIDVVEITPLTLHDRRVYNLLIETAWNQIDQDIQHTISKSELRGTHSNNEHVNGSIKRLMGAIAELKVEKDGEPATERVHLLSDNIEHDREDGLFYYSFTKRMREIIRDSRQFGKLQKEVMFALSSKYALALYEMVQKRGNLSYKFDEEFTIPEIRALLSVPEGKLIRFADVNAYVLKPSVEEVSALSDYNIKMEPIKQGREVVRVRLSWWKKSTEEVKEAFKELRRPRVGRRARISGRVERLEMELNELKAKMTESIMNAQ